MRFANCSGDRFPVGSRVQCADTSSVGCDGKGRECDIRTSGDRRSSGVDHQAIAADQYSSSRYTTLPLCPLHLPRLLYATTIGTVMCITNDSTRDTMLVLGLGLLQTFDLEQHRSFIQLPNLMLWYHLCCTTVQRTYETSNQSNPTE